MNARRFREVVRRGAFSESLRSRDDIIATVEHDSERILGRTSNGTLRLTEDERGLRYEIDLPDTQVARDLVRLIQRGDVRHSSFRFNVRAGGELWRRDGAGQIRELRSVRLIDISAVGNPAYQATSVGLRYAWQRALSVMRDRLRLADAESWWPGSATLANMARRLRRAEAK